MEENLYTSNFEKGFSLKSKLLLFIKAILFAAAILPFVYFVGVKYKTASTENLINTYNKGRWEEFYSLEDNSIDTVFLGSSHSYCTFDPETIDPILGTSSYQMGMPFQHYDSTYFTLSEILNHHKIKTAVVEVYWDMLDDDFELKQAAMLFQVLKNKELENQYIDEVFPLDEKIKYSINALKYQEDYFAYQTSELKKKIEAKYGVSLPTAQRQEGIEQYRSRGYTYCDYKMLPSELDETNQFRKFDGKDWQISSVQKNWLIKIINLCRENDIKLIFVTAPIANVSMDYIKNYDVIHNCIADIAAEYDIAYYDYNIINKEEHLLTLDNFRDDAHLNNSGVEIVSKHFANLLLK